MFLSSRTAWEIPCELTYTQHFQDGFLEASLDGTISECVNQQHQDRGVKGQDYMGSHVALKASRLLIWEGKMLVHASSIGPCLQRLSARSRAHLIPATVDVCRMPHVVNTLLAGTHFEMLNSTLKMKALLTGQLKIHHTHIWKLYMVPDFWCMWGAGTGLYVAVFGGIFCSG